MLGEVTIGSQKEINIKDLGVARATGGTPTSASNLPIFLWVLGDVSRSVSHRRLTVSRPGSPDGLPLVPPKGGPDGLPNGSKGETKKSPDSRGYCQGVSGGGKPVGDIWVYPGGLTIPLYCPEEHLSILTENIFFSHKNEQLRGLLTGKLSCFYAKLDKNKKHPP